MAQSEPGATNSLERCCSNDPKMAGRTASPARSADSRNDEREVPDNHTELVLEMPRSLDASAQTELTKRDQEAAELRAQIQNLESEIERNGTTPVALLWYIPRLQQ